MPLVPGPWLPKKGQPGQQTHSDSQ